MGADITKLLDDWPYDSDHNVRIISAEDGRRVMQVRQPLGIEQYELDGRPDGLEPDGFDSVVAAVDHRLEEHRALHGSDEEFELTEAEREDMQAEGILFYYRYLLLFQMTDYERVIRDTGHNLRICELLELYADDEQEAEEVLQFKPYIYRMHAVSRAMLAAQHRRNGEARSILEAAITAIQGMDEIDSPAFQFERVRSVNYLRSALEQIEEPRDRVEQLQHELADAVAEEDYERAARLRDHIRELS